MPENLKGLIERVTYHNPENGFAVLKVKVKGRQDLVTVVGSTTSVTVGEHLEATGRWFIDRQHGEQFKAEELKTKLEGAGATVEVGEMVQTYYKLRGWTEDGRPTREVLDRLDIAAGPV